MGDGKYRVDRVILNMVGVPFNQDAYERSGMDDKELKLKVATTIDPEASGKPFSGQLLNKVTWSVLLLDYLVELAADNIITHEDITRYMDSWSKREKA